MVHSAVIQDVADVEGIHFLVSSTEAVAALSWTEPEN